MNVKPTMLLIAGSLFLSVAPAQANPIGLNPQDMVFCAEVRDRKLAEATAHNSSTNWGGGASFNPLTLSGSANVNHSQSASASSQQYMGDYYAKNCDILLQQMGQVAIADINANKEVAIARIRNEGYRYSQDTQRIIAGMGLEANKENNRTQRIGTAINTVGGIFQALITAGVEKRRIEASVQIASITADPNLALLQKWGLQQIPCMSTGVAILIDEKRFCTQTTHWLSAGTYRYNRAEDRLDLMAQPMSSPDVASPSQPTIQPTQLPQVNIQPSVQSH